MPRSTVSVEVRAAAIADLEAGEQPAVVAERYNISRDTVKMWKQRFVTTTVTSDVTVTPAIIQPKVERRRLEIGALVLDLLAAKLEASKAIAVAASDPAWLREQSADQLATLGEWLDTTALALGDRLAAGASAEPEQRDLIR